PILIPPNYHPPYAPASRHPSAAPPLHVALPISRLIRHWRAARETLPPVAAWESIVKDTDKRRDWVSKRGRGGFVRAGWGEVTERSEEHTSELQSREKLVCRLRLEKKRQTLSEKH